MREWPSIVPVAPEIFQPWGDVTLNYETTIADLMTGQHSDPLRVVMFSADTDRAEDVSRALAHAASTLKGATCRQSWKTSSTATSVETAN